MISSELDILETTLRDGNYVVDFQFTARDTGWLAGKLEACGMNYIEIGHGLGIGASQVYASAAASDAEYIVAAKAAVSNFTQWLAVHLAQDYSQNIRVNAIAPGFFLTNQNRFLLTDEKTGEPTKRGKSIIGHTPMGRYGNPDDLIGTIVWLLSDASAFVSGIVVPIDGGFSAFSGV